jgi:hypothetical protein
MKQMTAVQTNPTDGRTSLRGPQARKEVMPR